VRPAERYRRRRLRCPACGKRGELVVGAGRFPFVQHRSEPEINTGPSPCWLGPDHPLVRALKEGGPSAALPPPGLKETAPC